MEMIKANWQEKNDFSGAFFCFLIEHAERHAVYLKHTGLSLACATLLVFRLEKFFLGYLSVLGCSSVRIRNRRIYLIFQELSWIETVAEVMAGAGTEAGSLKLKWPNPTEDREQNWFAEGFFSHRVELNGTLPISIFTLDILVWQVLIG